MAPNSSSWKVWVISSCLFWSKKCWIDGEKCTTLFNFKSFHVLKILALLLPFNIFVRRLIQNFSEYVPLSLYNFWGKQWIQRANSSVLRILTFELLKRFFNIIYRYTAPQLNQERRATEIGQSSKVQIIVHILETISTMQKSFQFFHLSTMC